MPSEGTDLDVTVSFEGRALVLLPRGDIDMASVPALVSCLQAAADGEGTSLVVGMAGVTFMDSSGLNALLGARKALVERGLHLTVRNAGGLVRKVFDMSGTAELFDIT